MGSLLRQIINFAISVMKSFFVFEKLQVFSHTSDVARFIVSFKFNFPFCPDDISRKAQFIVRIKALSCNYLCAGNRVNNRCNVRRRSIADFRISDTQKT